MDFDCKYIDKKERYCSSPELDDTKIQCFCFDCTKCSYFPKQELKILIEEKEESDLEKGVKE